MKNTQNHSRLRQPYGNHIAIHLSSSSSASSSSSSSLPSLPAPVQPTAALDRTSAAAIANNDPIALQDVETEQETELKPSLKHSTFISSLYSYFARLLLAKKRPENGTAVPSRGSSAGDAASCLQTAQWWRFKSSKASEWKRNQRFSWCFRPVGTVVVHGKTQKPLKWTSFQKKNQLILTRQYETIMTNDCCKIQDRNIQGGNAVVTVLLREHIAFILDPELSEAVTFEIAWLPKLTLLQQLRERRDYKRYMHHQP